jgi:hypothetical protein
VPREIRTCNRYGGSRVGSDRSDRLQFAEENQETDEKSNRRRDFSHREKRNRNQFGDGKESGAVIHPGLGNGLPRGAADLNQSARDCGVRFEGRVTRRIGLSPRQLQR